MWNYSATSSFNLISINIAKKNEKNVLMIIAIISSIWNSTCIFLRLSFNIFLFSFTMFEITKNVSWSKRSIAWIKAKQWPCYFPYFISYLLRNKNVWKITIWSLRGWYKNLFFFFSLNLILYTYKRNNWINK